jgi:isoquinoline 1-oxidoreductase beta subunit
LQTVEQAVVAALGVPAQKVTLNTVWAGGSFGRRATPNAGTLYLAEAAMIGEGHRRQIPRCTSSIPARTISRAVAAARCCTTSCAPAWTGAGKLIAWETSPGAARCFIIGSPSEAMIS